MSQRQRAGKLEEPKEMDKDKLHCDIPTEIVEPDQSNEIEKNTNILENYFKLEVNDFVNVSVANERQNKSFSRLEHDIGQILQIGKDHIELNFLKNKINTTTFL